MGKKVMWICLLILVIAIIILGFVFIKPKDNNQVQNSATVIGNKIKEENVIKQDSTQTGENQTDGGTVYSNTESKEGSTTNKDNVQTGTYQKVELADGTLYSKTGKTVKADKVVGTEYFDTTINDMWTNPKDYEGKMIEIEGFYLENTPYMFVGRYSVNNLCPYCPQGYSYFEISLDGSIDRTLTNASDWVKVVGKFTVGNDESTGYTDYYYLDVETIEIMKQRGVETVSN